MIDYLADLHDAPAFKLPSKAQARKAGRAHRPTPVVKPFMDLCRCLDMPSTTRLVAPVLTGNTRQRFMRRAGLALGPNALIQIASEFVEFGRSM